jgi:DNA topoisomerase-1
MSSNFVIVESPAKAKTIKRFLGKGFAVEASMGHVRDLPESTLGVDTDEGFTPTYEVPKEKESVVKHLKAALKDCDELWVATDEDREGEAIGWHLVQVLDPKGKKPHKRIVFHEITEEAIRAAAAAPRDLDMNLVNAQQARRILDRLVGYTLSPFLWKKVFRGLSAGRVQSVAVRIIVDREREVQAFKPQEYWSIDADLDTKGNASFSASLEKHKGKKLEMRSKEQVDQILRDLEGAAFAVESLEEKEVQRTAPAPFTTSTLQQEAARKLGFSVKQTMVVAQQLYEGMSMGKGEGSTGLITYMRTDSVNLSTKALDDAKRVIEQQFGREYVLAEPRTYKSKSKGAQEAHEAIRPTELERIPASLEAVLDHQQLKLYTLIWNRTVATQMPAAQFKRIGADICASAYTFRATGQTILFDGFLRVYSEGKDELPEGQQAEDDNEKLLPSLSQGETLLCQKLSPEQHFTKPPPRYTEASLVKKLEEEGIGRPSTYAPTISTIQQRGYIAKEGSKLLPQQVAFTVTDLLTEHFPDIVDLQFTATMEQDLDDIAEGKKKEKAFLKEFFIPFNKLIESKTKEIQKSDVMKEYVLGRDPQSGLEVVARTGRFGPYVQLGRLSPEDLQKQKGKKEKRSKPKTASLPRTALLESVTLEQALALLSFPRTLGKNAGEDVQVLLGRFGPYVKCGKATAALPKGEDPLQTTLQGALLLLKEREERGKKAAEPLRVLGESSGKSIIVKDGRYGPYVTDGTTNASLGKKHTPENITLEEALVMLEKKRTAPKRQWRK